MNVAQLIGALPRANHEEVEVCLAPPSLFLPVQVKEEKDILG